MAASRSRWPGCTLLRAAALLLCLVASATAIQLPKMNQLPERAEMWRSAVAKRAAKVKIAPPPKFQPGQVAVGGSAIFMGAGLILGSPSRIAAGLATALIVSGPVQILDIAIMENASGKSSMSASLSKGLDRMLLDPKVFISSQETALVYCLFGATYATANLCKILAVPSVPSLLAVTAANMGACFYKDSELARLCGQGPRREFPLKSFLCLAGRDLISVASAFTLPAPVSKVLKTTGLASRLSDNLAQISCPVLTQTLQVPFHLGALSFYNDPEHTWAERVAKGKKLYSATVGARMARALPCYGAGGVINTNLQTLAMKLVPCTPPLWKLGKAGA